ncbi:MAG: VanZ family protein [Thiotrichaceae bacterium]
MHKLITFVRELRQQGAFKISTRLLLIFLMVLGLWVATMPLTGYALPKVNDKLVHLVVFFGFALLTDLATARKPFWLWKGLPLLCYGAFIEILQNFTVHRSFELADLAADAGGIVLYYMLKYWLRESAMKQVKT